MSIFITFEGGEGAGKSLQARTLERRLSQLVLPVVLTHEPGGTSFSRRIVRWLKWSPVKDMSPLTELFLFNASRAQLVSQVIKPGLGNDKIVICDRYTDSTLAYQGYGRGLDLEMIRLVNKVATEGIIPSLTFLLDLPVEDGLARKRAGKQDRFQQETLAFHRRVRQGYLKLASAEPERWLVIDAAQPKDKIAQIIWQEVRKRLSSQKD